MACYSALFLLLVGGMEWWLAQTHRLPSSLEALSAWEVGMLALATFRLTRIVAREEVGRWVRALFPAQSRSLLLRTAASLVRCPWCFGVWTAAVLTSGYLLWPSLTAFPILLLAVAGLAIAVHTAVGALRPIISSRGNANELPPPSCQDKAALATERHSC